MGFKHHMRPMCFHDPRNLMTLVLATALNCVKPPGRRNSGAHLPRFQGFQGGHCSAVLCRWECQVGSVAVRPRFHGEELASLEVRSSLVCVAWRCCPRASTCL